MSQPLSQVQTTETAVLGELSDPLVSTDPEIMGGAPCFTGMRVPIDTVLASLDRGVGEAELRESFRFLTDTHLSAARVYAAGNPYRSRP